MTAYEPLRAAVGVADADDVGVGVGAAAVGVAHAAIRKAVATSRAFILPERRQC